MKEITLTRGHVTQVDDEDFERLNRWKWHFNVGYARRKIYINPRYSANLYMHDDILGVKGVDHIDTNGLNNQKRNLRQARQHQNCANRSKGKNNTSGFKGVCWIKKSQKWRASIHPKRKTVYLGEYATREEAAEAYNEAAVRYFGEFARLNIL